MGNDGSAKTVALFLLWCLCLAMRLGVSADRRKQNESEKDASKLSTGIKVSRHGGRLCSLAIVTGTHFHRLAIVTGTHFHWASARDESEGRQRRV